MKKKPIITTIKWIFLLLLLCFLTFVAYAGIKLYNIRSEALELVEQGGDDAFRQALTTLVYDADGNVIAMLNSEKDAYYLGFQDIPYMVKEIFLVTEDRSFYEHSGVDYKSILRAFIALLENEGEITQGGSTITQQLARNIYLSHEVSLNRKLQEMFIARELENRYSKDKILEFYINNIYFGNGLYGVSAAAKGYFSRDVSELSLSELCFICAIPNNPETYNPLEHMENTMKRRNRILRQLLEQQVINGDDYETAIAEEIELNLGEKVKHNYVETFVRYSATRELMRLRGFEFQYFFNTDTEKEAYTEEYNRVYGECNSLLFTGGYRIYTSIDMEMQEKLQEVLDSRLAVDGSVNDDGIYNLQGSAVTIDNSTGYVTAIVGGREQEYAGYTLNRAYQSFRQPGSSIKPVLIYTPLFERGYTPDSVVTDERIPGGPVNSPNVYGGDITIRTALVLSKNTIAWEMFNKIGCYTCAAYLLNMQFSHIVKADYVPAMSLGGMTYGVSSLEMASAYATLANEGMYRNPTCIVKITDSFGQTVLDNGSSGETGKLIYGKEATLMATNVLKDVLVWGTGREYQIENAICAGKTGTTNDNRDCWFVGYSRYYTTAVWCGYDMPKTLEGDIIKSAGLIWHDYMEGLHDGLEKKDFDVYRGYNAAVEEETEKESEEEPTEMYTEEEFTQTPTEENTTETYSEETGGEDYTEEFTTEEYEYPSETPYIPETSEGDGLYVQPY